MPGIPFGRFIIRFPFIHYKFEYVELFEGLIMCAACMSGIPVIQKVLEVPYEVAWSMVIINGVFYQLHSILGDPVTPGWVTPAIPLTTAYLLSYPVGPERIKALIALQIMVAFIFIFLGVTKLADKVVNDLPNGLKGGILLGAGMSAVFDEFKTGGRFGIYPYTIALGVVVMYFMVCSPMFLRWKKNNKFAAFVGGWGILPAFLIAIIAGPLFGEIQAPFLEIGSVIKIPEFGKVLQQTIFAVGFPGVSYFLKGIATAVVIYVIAYGDFITAAALIGKAEVTRDDETIDYNPSRASLVCGIRNVGMALISPYPNMCGPCWEGAYTAITRRYAEGPKAMDSLVGGVGIFRWATLLGVALIPINGLVKNVLPCALSMMMMMQGYVCMYLGMDAVDNEIDRAVAGIMGVLLTVLGATWGLIYGILLYLLLNNWGGTKKVKTTESAAS